MGNAVRILGLRSWGYFNFHVRRLGELQGPCFLCLHLSIPKWCEAATFGDIIWSQCLLIDYSFTPFLSVLCIRIIRKTQKNHLINIICKCSAVCCAFILFFVSWRGKDEICILQPATRGLVSSIFIDRSVGILAVPLLWVVINEIETKISSGLKLKKLPLFKEKISPA